MINIIGFECSILNCHWFNLIWSTVGYKDILSMLWLLFDFSQTGGNRMQQKVPIAFPPMSSDILKVLLPVILLGIWTR